MRKSLLIAADVDPRLAKLAGADERFELRVQPVRTEDELAAAVAGVHVLVTRTYNRVSRRVLEAARDLELIAQATSGIDNIDIDAARARGIEVLNLPGENANAVAELVIGCMLALTRTVPFYTREVRSGRWTREDCATRHEMRHYKLGIVGLGEVGRRVARLGAAFGMDVLAFDPYISDVDFQERSARRAPSLDALVDAADILTLHVPLTAETRMIIDRDVVDRLRPGAILINAARGEVLDSAAALEALREDRLGGLALDVFEEEPPRTQFPDDPRLILTPHVGGCTHECRSGLSERLFARIAAFYATR